MIITNIVAYATVQYSKVCITHKRNLRITWELEISLFCLYLLNYFLKNNMSGLQNGPSISSALYRRYIFVNSSHQALTASHANKVHNTTSSSWGKAPAPVSVLRTWKSTLQPSCRSVHAPQVKWRGKHSKEQTKLYFVKYIINCVLDALIIV